MFECFGAFNRFLRNALKALKSMGVVHKFRLIVKTLRTPAAQKALVHCKVLELDW